jgi:3-hydroxy-9,10-secoandrosta-1,3,5(10)-triene-9,17-dione monooxygenase reductase component
MPVDSDAFRHALGRFASGVTVVTTAHEGQLAGLTVSAFSSVSLNPPLVLVCIDKRSSSIDLITRSRVFNVNILASEQEDTSNHFASRIADKFATAQYRTGTLGAPVLVNTLAYLECQLVESVDAGDHIVLIGQVEASEVDETKEPLLYYHGKYRSLAK